MKKKKIYMMIIAILILCLIAIMILIILKNDNNNININEKSENISEIFQNLMNNNYLYYYYYYGNIKIGDGYIEEDGEKYYYVNDEIINNMSESIINIINETFVVVSTEELLNPENTNKYIQLDGLYYVKKGENICYNIKEYNLDSITYEKINDESIYITFDNNSTHIFSVEGPWKLRTNLIYCLD